MGIHIHACVWCSICGSMCAFVWVRSMYTHMVTYRIKYLSPPKYGVEAFAQNEYEGLLLYCEPDELQVRPDCPPGSNMCVCACVCLCANLCISAAGVVWGRHVCMYSFVWIMCVCMYVCLRTCAIVAFNPNSVYMHLHTHAHTLSVCVCFMHVYACLNICGCVILCTKLCEYAILSQYWDYVCTYTPAHILTAVSCRILHDTYVQTRLMHTCMHPWFKCVI